MGYQTVSTFYARKPLRAEHPIGSDTIVEYKPGDIVPAGEWGAAANWLVENGRVAEMFDNVWVDDDGDAQVSPSSQVREKYVISGEHESGPPAFVNISTAVLDPSPYDESAPVEDFAYPLHEGSGWYLLSNGEKVRGKENALEAEEAL